MITACTNGVYACGLSVDVHCVRWCLRKTICIWTYLFDSRIVWIWLLLITIGIHKLWLSKWLIHHRSRLRLATALVASLGECRQTLELKLSTRELIPPADPSRRTRPVKITPLRLLCENARCALPLPGAREIVTNLQPLFLRKSWAL